MKLQILSDLHLSVQPLAPPRSDADLVILAGDIDRPAAAMAWALALDKPVVYVPGNHEFYGSSLGATVAELKRLAAGTRVRVLDNEVAFWPGLRIVGSTLWTDYLACGHGAEQDRAIAQALAFNRDFSRIRCGEPGAERLFTPQDAAALFVRNAAWLAQTLATPFAGSTLVVTHHAPSLRSIHPRFAGSPLNAGFVSNAEQLLDGTRVQLWVHGHTHDGFDYRVKGCRVLCNPRGYAPAGANENAAFDPLLTVQLGA